MHSSEWLHEAKKVPLGQKRRVYHGAESTQALDVYNNVDSWSAYCHRCKESAYVRKELVGRVQNIAPVYRKYVPTRLMTPQDLYLAEYNTWLALVKLLHRKGVSLALLEKYNTMYSPIDQRLVFRFKGVSVGRDVTEQSAQKWFVYHSDNPMQYVYLQSEKMPTIRERVVLVEDLFSAIKVHAYTGLSTVWLMGTNFKDSVLELLVNKEVVVFTDGDKAGTDCANTVKRRCDLFNIPCEVIKTKAGYDPKDYKGYEIQEVLNVPRAN